MMDFYLTASLKSLIKLNITSQTLLLSEMNLSQCCTQNFSWAYDTFMYRVLGWNDRPSTMVRTCVNFFFKSLEYLDRLKK